MYISVYIYIHIFIFLFYIHITRVTIYLWIISIYTYTSSYRSHIYSFVLKPLYRLKVLTSMIPSMDDYHRLDLTWPTFPTKKSCNRKVCEINFPNNSHFYNVRFKDGLRACVANGCRFEYCLLVATIARIWWQQKEWNNKSSIMVISHH